MTITCILPVTLEETASGARGMAWRANPDQAITCRLDALFQSARLFLASVVDRIIVICPAAHRNALESLAAGKLGKISFSVLDEEELIARCNPHYGSWTLTRTHGWYRQQILKLASACLVESEFYMTIDSDIVFRRKVHPQDLFSGSLAIAGVETFSDYQTLYTPSFAERELSIKSIRYANSRQLLNVGKSSSARTHFYSETPVLLSRSVVKRLLERLERTHGASWLKILSTIEGWSEYGLYYECLELDGDSNNTISPRGRNAILDLDRSVWQPSTDYRENRDYRVSHFFDPWVGGIAFAVQSWIDPVAWLPCEYGSLENFYAQLTTHLNQLESFQKPDPKPKTKPGEG